ncbi:MAG: penicillin acylase family protein [Pseudomonadales bacterium]
MIKPAFIFASVLLCSSCAVNQTNTASTSDTETLKIVRDHYGTAHVYADTTFDLFYGYGFAVAQDRLFQMEMARRSTQGTVAEVLGKEFAKFDAQTRALFSPSSIKKQMQALSVEDRDVFEGYAAGINHWLNEVKREPQKHQPQEFTQFNFEPSIWTAYDVAMIFVGTMVNRFGDYNTELENLQILRTLETLHGEAAAAKIFDDLNPRFTSGTPTTISEQDWQRPTSLVNTPRVSFPQDSVAASIKPHKGSSGFSNCYVLGPNKASGANAILVNGPQFGWYVPAYVYSIGLHGAGFDLVGNTPFAYPAVAFGHNADISWGSTWGAGDIVDLFQHELNPENSEQYLYKGKYLNFERRSETIKVSDDEDQQIVVRRSVHGQITNWDPDHAIAHSKRRSWDGLELQAMLSWMHSTKASDTKDWLYWAEKMPLNINWYYADRSGDIAYAFTGHYPERKVQHDNRIPTPGDGSMDWLGTQDFTNNPHAINPSSGYIANWNNKPADGVLNPDEFWYSWSAADRIDYLHEKIDAADKMNPEQAWALIESSSFADINAKYFLPLIDASSQVSNDQQIMEANALLQSWNRYSRDANEDGYFDTAATLIFRALLRQLVSDVLADDLGEAFAWFADTGYPSPGKPTGSGHNISASLKTLLEALSKRSDFDFLNGDTPEKVIAASLTKVLKTLASEQGVERRATMSDWRLANAPRPFTHKNFMGVPQTTEQAAMLGPIEQNRGTENNMTVLNKDRIVAYEVLPPGNSGFIDQKGERSEHFDDQFEMYNRFEKKRMWFYSDDVEANAASTEFIRTYRSP